MSKMATLAPAQSCFAGNSPKRCAVPSTGICSVPRLAGSCTWSHQKKKRSLTVVAAVGDVSADGTTYLIAGAAAVALLGTAFPIVFSRKDL